MTFPSSFKPIEEEEISIKEKFPSTFKSTKKTPGYRSVLKGAAKAATSLPTFGGPISAKLGERVLEELLPTPKTGLYPYVEKATESIAEGSKFGLPGAIAGGVGGTLSELAKQKNAPKWVQTLTEIAPWLFTERGLIPKKNQKEVVNFLRKEGFSDKEITPLLQGKTKLSMLSKVGKRGPKVEERLDKISKNFDRSYEIFRKKGKDLPMPKNQSTKFLDKFEEVWDDIPADQRKLMEPLKEDLLNKPLTRASLQDFFHGINRTIYGKGSPGSKEILNKLKDPIYEGIEMIDPGAAKDFKLLNELNVKKYQVMRKLSPNQLDRLVAIGELGGILTNAVAGNFKTVGGMLGEVAARQLATEMLINPHLQNLSNKMVVALGKNQVAIYEKLEKRFLQELKKSQPDLFEKITKEQSEQEKSRQ